MQYDTYPYVISAGYRRFEFVSEGKNGLFLLVVELIPISIPGIYNLGFGVLEHNGKVDDQVKTNNGDMEKILATVADAVATFVTRHDGAGIYFRGSTVSRTRLYQRAISLNFDYLSENFYIFGFTDGDWITFRKGIHFEGFLAFWKHSKREHSFYKGLKSQ